MATITVVNWFMVFGFLPVFYAQSAIKNFQAIKQIFYLKMY